MRISWLKLSVGCLVLQAAATAHAGFIYGTWDSEAVSGSSTTWNGFSYGGSPLTSDLLGDTTAPLSSLEVIPNLATTGTAPSVFDFSGAVNSDPSVDLIEKITNTTTNTTWTALSVQVDPAPSSGSIVSNLVGTTGNGSATQVFTTATTNADIVTFSGGAIAPGQTAVLEVTFDVSAASYPDTFAYQISNSVALSTAVPEPVSLASLLGVSGIALLRRQR